MNPPAQPAPAAARCLLVDDDPQVRAVLARSIQSQGLECLQAGNGAQALAVLEEQGEVPICITDIYMPEMDGVRFLRAVRERYPDMAVIMLTGVAEVGTAVECLQIGALDYISKPVLLDEVKARVANALEKRNLVLQNRFYQQSLESRVRELDTRNKQSLLNGVEMLVFALEAKDSYTSGHSMRVKEFAARTAVHLGFTGDALAQVELGSKLHDIGKIGIRETILNKPAILSPEEFEHIKLHVTLGERILQPFLAEKPPVLRIVRHHHERWDGTGFPDGLEGEAIPIEARIVAVADAYDAMTTNRAYRPPRNPAGALEELRRGAGSQFDPDVVAAFLRACPDLATHPLSA
ncbi:MAG TPA: HD domain-containing phosphohydrolase [Gemmatimonadales bacterium]